MMIIKIDTSNAAFNADATTQWERDYIRNEEIKRILKNVCNQLDNGNTSGRCIDINGNTVGKWEVNTK